LARVTGGAAVFAAVLALASILAGTVVTALGVGGCLWDRGQPLWSRPDLTKVPEEVAQWVANSLPLDAGQAKTVGDKTYLLVTWGPQPQGSKVEIIAVEQVPPGSTDLDVTVRYTKPSGESGAAETVRPYDLVVANLAAGEVSWVVEGQPEARVMQVLGEVRPIVAESRWIKLFSPAPGARVSPGFVLAGLANVFEGTVNFRLLTAAGDVLIPESYTTAAMGDWGPFREELRYDLPAGVAETEGVLEVYWISPMDGSRLDLITVPLVLGR